MSGLISKPRRFPSDTPVRSAYGRQGSLPPTEGGEDEHFDPRDYSWEFRPPGIQDVQTLVDLIHNNSEDRSEDGNDSEEEGHVKRISNKFFVYRSHFLRAYRNVVDPSSGMAVRPVPQRHISKLAGHVWKEVLTEKEREPYHLAYLQLKAEFEAAHPDYRYRPKTKEEKERMKEKQKEKRVQMAEFRRVQRKEREIEDNRRRVAAGYSHRAWRKLKKAVKGGMPDPLAEMGGCIDPAMVKVQESDDERDEAPDFPEIDAPAVPAHMRGHVLQAVQLLEKNEDMRASQAWHMTATPEDIRLDPRGMGPPHPTSVVDCSGDGAGDMSIDSLQSQRDTDMVDAEVRSGLGDFGLPFSKIGLQEEVRGARFTPVSTPSFGPRFPFSETSNGFFAPPPGQQQAESTTAGPLQGAQHVPTPSFMHGADEPYPLGSVRSGPPISSIMSLQSIEAVLSASSSTPPSTPTRKPAIQFGRADPSKMVFSTPSSTSSAKRRMVMHEHDSPMEKSLSIRDEMADPVRGVERDETMSRSPASDAVRTPRTPDMSERMAPVSAENSPFQVIPMSFKPRPRGNLGGFSPELSDRGRGSSLAVHPKVPSASTIDGLSLTPEKLRSQKQLGNGMPSWANGKRRLSPDAQGGRSRQPSLAFGLFSRQSRSRQPSMVVGLVDGMIKLVPREEWERLESLSTSASLSPGESSGMSLLSEPSDAVAELMASSSFDAEIHGADLEAYEQLADDADGKHVQAYHWLGAASLAAVFEGVDSLDTLGPRMSFSEFMSSLPEHLALAPDPEALKTIQDQLDDGLVDESTYEALLAYSGYPLSLDDTITF